MLMQKEKFTSNDLISGSSECTYLPSYRHTRTYLLATRVQTRQAWGAIVNYRGGAELID